jgi:hypothetical protein
VGEADTVVDAVGSAGDVWGTVLPHAPSSSSCFYCRMQHESQASISGVSGGGGATAAAAAAGRLPLPLPPLPLVGAAPSDPALTPGAARTPPLPSPPPQLPQVGSDAVPLLLHGGLGNSNGADATAAATAAAAAVDAALRQAVSEGTTAVVGVTQRAMPVYWLEPDEDDSDNEALKDERGRWVPLEARKAILAAMLAADGHHHHSSTASTTAASAKSRTGGSAPSGSGPQGR